MKLQEPVIIPKYNRFNIKSTVFDEFIDILKNENLKGKEEEIIREYAKKFYYFIKVLKLRAKKKWDNVIAITGEEGVGKSTLAYWIAKTMEKNLDFEKNYLITTEIEELVEKIQNKKIKVIVCDEAIRQFYKQEWYSPLQKYINKLYALARKERKTTILCMPRFLDFNEFFRNHRIRFWLHCISRGCAVLFVPDWNPFAKDPWWIDQNQKAIEKLLKFVSLTKIDLDRKIKALKRSKNFVTELFFPPMKKEDEELYYSVVVTKSYEGIDYQDEKVSEREARLRRAIARSAALLFDAKEISLTTIAKKLGLSPKTLMKYIEDYEPDLKTKYEKWRKKSTAISQMDVNRLPFV